MTATNKMLSNSEIRYNYLIGSIPEVIGELDLDGTISFVSPQVHDMLGYHPNEMIGTNFIKFIHPDDVPGIKKATKKAIKSKKVMVQNLRLKNKKGNYNLVFAKGKLIKLDDKARLIGFIRDTTKLNETEEKLEESQDIFKQLIEVFLKFKEDPFVNLQLLINTAGLLLKADCALFNILKRENGKEVLESLVTYNESPNFTRKSDPKGHICTDIIKDNPDDVVIISNLDKTNYAKTDENVKKYDLKQYVSYVVRFNNKPTATFCVVYIENREMSDNDINILKILSKSASSELARWNSQIDLQKSEKKFHTAVENNPDYIVCIDCKGTILDVNRLERGFTKDMIIDQSVFNETFYETKDQCESAREKINSVIKTGKTTSYEYSQIAPDGSLSFYETKISPFEYDKENKLISLQLATRDITQRRNLEQKLINSEEKYRTLFESSKDGIVFSNMEGKIMECNQTYLNMLGYTLEEIKEFSYRQLTPEKWHEKEADIFNNQFLQRGFSGEFEKEYIRKDGSIIPISINLWLIKDDQGNNNGMWAIVRDITARKKAEQKLKDSEEKFRTIAEQSLAAIGIFQNNEIKYLNKAYEEFTGISLDEIYSMTVNELIDTVMIPEERVRIKTHAKVTQSGERRAPDITESQVITKDGKKKWVQAHTKSISFQGRPAAMHMILDITERRKTELKLKDSEEKYRLLFENANDGISILDLNGNFYEVNNLYCMRLGYTREEILKSNIRDITTPEYADLVSNRILDVREKGFNIFESAHKAKDGRIIPIEISSKYILYDDKPSILSIARDITERTIAEQKVIESEAKHRDLLETAVMGIVEFDVIGKKVSYVNPKLLAVLGYTKEELLNEKIFMEIIHPEDQKNLIRSRKEKYVEFRIFTKGGKLKWLSGTRNNLFNQDGELINARLWLQDSTESKEVEGIKSNLLTRFSHEFKTPLISITGFADFLLTEHKKKLDDKTLSFLKRIKDGSSRLKILINSFVEGSQLDKAIIQVNLRQENLYNLIKEVLEEFEGVIHMREHLIDLNMDKHLITHLDKEKIYTVITNLLINALNYTPKGGKISIQSKIDKKSLVISIKDNGIGLDESERIRLFKPFGKIERYGKGWDIVVGGMGMGLFISKEIIELHEGKIWVESEGRNKGSTFNFSIPITE